MNKSLLLLTCSSLVLGSVTTTFPPAMADDGVAGGVYYSIPFAGAAGAGEPVYGFRMDRKVEEDVVFAPDALTGADDPLRPAMVDFQFNDEGPVALKFGGMDALPVVAGPLGFHGDPNEPLDSAEHLAIFGGSAVALALIICAVAGCFSSGGGGDGGEHACWVARTVYGEHDLRWRMFRNWLMGEAPAWFRALYIAHGPTFAAWIADKPALKRAIRAWMNSKIARPVEA